MNEKDKTLQQKEETKELSDQELQEAVGGYYSGTYDQDPQGWLNQDDWFSNSMDRISKPKWPCPRCGSWDVTNFDPGWFQQMRVHCKKCGFWGCRDGSPN